jgi:hypothetical protein
LLDIREVDHNRMEWMGMGNSLSLIPRGHTSQVREAELRLH